MHSQQAEQLRPLAILRLASVAVVAAACASNPHNRVFDEFPASVNGHTDVIYYDVQGATFDELRRALRADGPKVDGRSFVGETRSPMKWNWRLESVGASQCSIREVTVSVNTQVTLPRWRPPPEADPALVVEWNRFVHALETHESGHKDISARAGRDIVARLRGMTGSCSQINSNANEIARAIVEKASQDQIAYDAQTRHGLTQGTTFRSPPPSQ